MDPWHIGARLRYWRKQRGLSTRELADLIGRSASWVQMAEERRRSPYNILDLVNIAVALRLDLGVFVTTPVPGIPDADQRAMLALLRQAFAGREPRAALRELAQSPQAADAEDLMLVVGPGGLRVVNRREALRAGGLAAITLTGSVGWLYGQETRVALAEGGTISMSGARSLRNIVTAYRSLDDDIGGQALRPGIASQLRFVEALKGCGKTDKVEQELGRIAGELEQLAGWLAHDSGDFDQAAGYYRRALVTSRRLGDHALSAYTLGWVSLLAGDTGRKTTEYAEDGVGYAKRTGSRRLVASLLLRSAWANAHAGNVHAVNANIDAAHAALAEVGKGEDPSFIYWMDQTSLDENTGRAFMVLNRPKQAAPFLRQALANCPDHTRRVAAVNGDLALCLAQAGEVSEAARIGIEADRLRQQCPSERLRRQLVELRGLLRDLRDPAAVELRERLVTA